MKVLTTYYSETGNTEEVARAIHDAVDVHDKTLLPISQVDDASGYDLVFCGFPVQTHGVPVAVHHFIKELPPGMSLALFATHGVPRGGELAKTAMIHAVSLAAKQKVVRTFACRGRVHPRVVEALKNQPEHGPWAEIANGAAKHPDENDLADVAAFAESVVATSLHHQAK